MAASDEVRVVAGYAYVLGWAQGQDELAWSEGGPPEAGDRPALLVIDSGLTAKQMRDLIASYGVRVTSGLAVTDTEATP